MANTERELTQSQLIENGVHVDMEKFNGIVIESCS